MKMSKEKLVLAVKAFIDDLPDVRKVILWNEYTESAHYYDDRIYSVADLDEELDGRKPTEIARMIHFGDFNPTHDWFWYDGYANLESTDYLDSKNCPYDPRTMAEYIVEHDNSLHDHNIRAILNEE